MEIYLILVARTLLLLTANFHFIFGYFQFIVTGIAIHEEWCKNHKNRELTQDQFYLQFFTKIILLKVIEANCIYFGYTRSR